MSECDKLVEHREDAQMLSEFVEWLTNRGYAVAKRTEHPGYIDNISYEPVTESAYERIFAEFFGIDIDLVEKERRELLKSLQNKGVKV